MKHPGIEYPTDFKWKIYFGKPGNLKLTVAMSIISICFYYSFYGFVYASPRILNEGYCTGTPAGSKKRGCAYSKSALFELFVTSCAEMVSNFFFFIAADVIGRLKAMRTAAIVGIIFSGLMLFCVSRILLVLAICVVRLINFGLWFITLLYISEVYPTHIRATLSGWLLGIGKFVAIVGIISSELLISINAVYFILTVLSVYIILTISTFVLDIETTGLSID